MKILKENSKLPQKVSLILGFFDGVHAGHCDVIKNTPKNEKVLITFSDSPAKYFKKEYSYIYSRQQNYDLIEKLGVEYIYELNFADIAKFSAEEYLKKLICEFNPISITTGFNHTFGINKTGDTSFLNTHQKSYKYFYTPATKIDNEIVSSTKIKEFLKTGNIEKANLFLTKNFKIKSKVIQGEQIGRKLGFPTANMKYPDEIIKIPYGVYKIKTLGKPAIMNWGIKPTFNSEEIIEVHIPNFNENLYNKILDIEIISKIRNEKKFNNIEDLRQQIKKDIDICLEL